MTIKIYKDKYREHMVKYGIWDIFYLTDPI